MFLPVEIEGKGRGARRVGGGQAKEPASQCARVCQNYPFFSLPFSFSPNVALVFSSVGDRYDWTTGAPHHGNGTTPRPHPSHTLLHAYCNSSVSNGAFSFPGATWDRFRCTVEPSPSLSFVGPKKCRKTPARFPD